MLSLLKRYTTIFFWLIVVATTTFISAPAHAGYCFCSDSVTKITIENYTDANFLSDNVVNSGCLANVAETDCTTDTKKATGGRSYATCGWSAGEQVCTEALSVWKQSYATQLQAVAKGKSGTEALTSKLIPNCALQDDLPPECRDISIFMIVAINVTRYMFSIIGALALLAFVYGGFLLIISQGNSEQVQKGKDAMVAAVIGLAVAFSGYLLIRFLGTVLGVGSDFTLL